MIKETVYTFNVQIAKAKRALCRVPLIGLVALVIATACNGPATLLDSDRAGTLDNPIPVGDPVEYKWGTVRILGFHRPTAFQVVEADVSTGVTESRPARPATGAEFVSIELEFMCAATETTCDGPPEAVLELVLADRRVVEEGFVPLTEAWMGEEEVVGGSTVTGWITFEVPAGTEIQALKITPFKESDAILDMSGAVHAVLPAPIDGYTIEFPWQSASDGSESRELPALRHDIEDAGFPMIWAGYYREEGETGLFVTMYTEELFFFEDSDAVKEARPALLTAADLWSTYGGDADYLTVELWNELGEETVALVGADAADVEAFLSGGIDQEGFAARWWVVND